MPELQAFYNESKNMINLVGVDIGMFTGLARQGMPKTFYGIWILLTRLASFPAVNPSNSLRSSLCQPPFLSPQTGRYSGSGLEP